MKKRRPQLPGGWFLAVPSSEALVKGSRFFLPKHPEQNSREIFSNKDARRWVGNSWHFPAVVMLAVFLCPKNQGRAPSALRRGGCKDWAPPPHPQFSTSESAREPTSMCRERLASSSGRVRAWLSSEEPRGRW